MGFKLKRLRKSVRKTIKRVSKGVGKVLSVAAPIVGGVLTATGIGAPVGLAIGAGGGALGGVLQGGNRKKKFKRIGRGIVIGAGATAAGALAPKLFTAAGSLFGGGKTPGINPDTGAAGEAIFPSPDSQGMNSSGFFESAAGLFGKGVGAINQGISGFGETLEKQGPGFLEDFLNAKLGANQGMATPDNSVFSQGSFADGGGDSSPAIPSWIWIAGAGVLLLFMVKK